MGLFDTLAGMAGGAMGGEAQQATSDALDNSSVGGVSGLLGMLQQNGLGSVVSPDQLRSVLGDEHVQNLANQFGVSPDEVLSHLSQHLPAMAAAQQGGDDS